MGGEAAIFAVVLVCFLLFVLLVVFLLFRGIRKDSMEYDERFLWDLFREKTAKVRTDRSTK